VDRGCCCDGDGLSETEILIGIFHAPDAAVQVVRRTVLDNRKYIRFVLRLQYSTNSPRVQNLLVSPHFSFSGR
jgi:hypothetical protein